MSPKDTSSKHQQCRRRGWAGEGLSGPPVRPSGRKHAAEEKDGAPLLPTDGHRATLRLTPEEGYSPSKSTAGAAAAPGRGGGQGPGTRARVSPALRPLPGAAQGGDLHPLAGTRGTPGEGPRSRPGSRCSSGFPVSVTATLCVQNHKRARPGKAPPRTFLARIACESVRCGQ